MFKYDKKTALTLFNEAKEYIKNNLNTFDNDDVWGGDFNAECLLVRETYRRLLRLWPGRKYSPREIGTLLDEFKRVDTARVVKEGVGGMSNPVFSLRNRTWLVDYAHGEWGNELDYLILCYTDLIDVGWVDLDIDGIISPEAIIVLDDLSEYMWKGKTLERIGDLLAKEDLQRERNAYLKRFIEYTLENPELFISDAALYTMEIPTCHSGNSMAGKLFFPIGAMLECWGDCPDFRLADGVLVIHWSGAPSGVCAGETYDPSTGVIRTFFSGKDNSLSWGVLTAASTPYRRKACKYRDSGVQPKDINEVFPMPDAIKHYRDNTWIRARKRH